MIKLKGKKVLVVGLGQTGESAVRFLVSQGAKVTVTDLKTKNELAERLVNLENLKFEHELGRHNPKHFTSADYIILSPGVPTGLEYLNEARAKNIPILNDIDLAYPFIKAPIIAVTGTNGKTTTASLISEMLKASGKSVFTGGNIGNPILNFVLNPEKIDVCVLELSSFQLELIQSFKPTVAVFTNLEPNHLDRYPLGLDSYYAAKKRLIKNADRSTQLVLNLDNERTAQLVDSFNGKTYYFTKRNPIAFNGALAEKFQGAYLNRPKMVLKVGTEETYELMFTKLPGDHNRENLMAAAIAAKLVGASHEAIQNTIDTFKGVAHRLEFVRKKDGVAIYNDSKATSVAALLRALSSFQAPIILIAGGRDKDQDFSPLTDLVRTKVKNLILIGEAKEKMNRAIGDFSETFLVGTFEEAILIAYQKSRNGEVILLSPACASYDMFKSYEERGEYFKKLVAQL